MGRTDGRDGLGMSAGLKSSPSDGQKNQEKHKHPENEHSDEETGRKNAGRIHTHTHIRGNVLQKLKEAQTEKKTACIEKASASVADFAADRSTK